MNAPIPSHVWINGCRVLNPAHMQAEDWSDSLRTPSQIRRLAMHDLCHADLSGITVRKVIELAAEAYGVTAADIIGHDCKRQFSWPRHHAIYEAKRSHPKMSLPQLGRIFGERNHASIIYALRVWPLKAAALGIECKPIRGVE